MAHQFVRQSVAYSEGVWSVNDRDVFVSWFIECIQPSTFTSLIASVEVLCGYRIAIRTVFEKLDIRCRRNIVTPGVLLELHECRHPVVHPLIEVVWRFLIKHQVIEILRVRRARLRGAVLYRIEQRIWELFPVVDLQAKPLWLNRSLEHFYCYAVPPCSLAHSVNNDRTGRSRWGVAPCLSTILAT